MATNYPTSLDTSTYPAGTLPSPLTTDLLASGSANLQHAYQHDTENAAIIAVETKVGILGSQDITSNYPASDDLRISLLEEADYTIVRPFGALDDEFIGTSLNAKWNSSTLVQSGVTVPVGRSALQLTIPSGNTGDHLSVVYQTLPGASTWTFEAKVGINVVPGGSVNSVAAGGLALYESATGKIIAFNWLIINGAVNVQGLHWSNTTTYAGSSEFTSYSGFSPGFSPKYLRIQKTASQYVYSVSYDGKAFWQAGAASITNYFTTAADHIGVYGDAYDIPSPSAIIDFDYFRQIA